VVLTTRFFRAADQPLNAGFSFVVGVADNGHARLAFKKRASIAQPDAHKIAVNKLLRVRIKYGSEKDFRKRR
jgi:hypothetical protein